MFVPVQTRIPFRAGEFIVRTKVFDVFFIVSPIARVARHRAFEPAIDCDIIPTVLSDARLTASNHSTLNLLAT